MKIDYFIPCILLVLAACEAEPERRVMVESMGPAKFKTQAQKDTLLMQDRAPAKPRVLCAKSAEEARWLSLPRAKNPLRALNAWARRAACREDELAFGQAHPKTKQLDAIAPKSIHFECLRNNRDCVALRKQGRDRQILPLTDCGAFNLLREEWGKKAKLSKKGFSSLAKTYLNVAHAFLLLEFLPKEQQGLLSAKRWFELHPEQSFTSPRVEREGSGFCMHYYRKDARGMLLVGELMADSLGQFLRHEEREVLRLEKVDRAISPPRGFCDRKRAEAWPDDAWALGPAKPVKPLSRRLDEGDGQLKWEELPKGMLDKAIESWFLGPGYLGSPRKRKKRATRRRLPVFYEDADKIPFFKVFNRNNLKLAKYLKRSALVVRVKQRGQSPLVNDWVVVRPGRHRMARIRNGGELNQAMGIMKSPGPRNKKEALAWGLALDNRVFDEVRASGGKVLYEARAGERFMSPRTWFELHPADPFYKPRALPKPWGWVIGFYSYREEGSGLFRHTIRIKKNGRLKSALLEKLSNRVRGQ